MASRVLVPTTVAVTVPMIAVPRQAPPMKFRRDAIRMATNPTNRKPAPTLRTARWREGLLRGFAAFVAVVLMIGFLPVPGVAAQEPGPDDVVFRAPYSGASEPIVGVKTTSHASALTGEIVLRATAGPPPPGVEEYHIATGFVQVSHDLPEGARRVDYAVQAAVAFEGLEPSNAGAGGTIWASIGSFGAKTWKPASAVPSVHNLVLSVIDVPPGGVVDLLVGADAGAGAVGLNSCFGLCYGIVAHASLEVVVESVRATIYATADDLPDLVVTDLRTEPEHPSPGETVILEATVTNQGGGAAGSSQSYFFVNDVFVGWDDAPSLGPAESATISTSWTAEEGTSTVRVQADVHDWVDEGNEANNEGEATVTVGAPNQAPVARDDVYAVGQDQTLAVPAPGVLGNDEDPEGGALTAHLESSPTHGMLTLATDGSFQYEPEAGFVGTDEFTYTAKDAAGATATARVVIQVEEAAPARGVELSPESQSGIVAASESIVYEILVTNTGTARDTIGLEKTANAKGWKASLSTASVTLEADESVVVELTVTAPKGKNASGSFTVEVTGTSVSDAVSATASATTTLSG